MGKVRLPYTQFLNQMFVVTILLVCVHYSEGLSRKIATTHHDLFIEIAETVPELDCSEILNSLELTLTRTPRHLYIALDGIAYFRHFYIILPHSWPDLCIPANRTVERSRGDPSDITILSEHKLFGDQIWTQQSGKCGDRGDQIFATRNSFKNSGAAQQLVKEWIKYQYGVFDEMGFVSDKIYPVCYDLDKRYITGCWNERILANEYCDESQSNQLKQFINKTAATSFMFMKKLENFRRVCNESTHDRLAPTKHNLLCDRKSVREIIMKNFDLSFSNSLENIPETKSLLSNPKISYKRRSLTRYVVLIDETQNMLVRESWSFLRSAIRKWLLYDLQSNTEIGIVLADETSVDKVLDLTPLDLAKNRDLVASFIPYIPGDSSQSACILCGIKQGLKLLSDRRQTHGFASEILLIIAPGMEFQMDYMPLTDWAIENRTRILTINFPVLLRHQPLDKLAHLTGGDAFTIIEKKYNSEKSFLSTYFDLTTILLHISAKYFEGPRTQLPIEIHRKELVDKLNDSNSSKRISRVISGNFYLDEGMTTPSGFFLYTHNVEVPLIQNVKLTSPGGVTYGTRSDQRIPVKQITIIASVDQMGPWTYRIERFNGNPQPHFVQVLATPRSSSTPVIRARAWFRRTESGGPIILYCEVKRGEYPVHGAYVEAHITRPTLQCNYTNNCVEKLRLLDTGSGDPDITKGDGIYSRYFSTISGGAGIYRFDIQVDDNGNTAYALPTAFENKVKKESLGLICCGSVISDVKTKQIAPFQRQLPPITITVNENERESESKSQFGRIGDLTGKFIGDGKIALSWTAPDMGGQTVYKYQVRYALSLFDIVNNFETIASVWTHASPYPYSIGDVTNFVVDINVEPRLFGTSLHLAVQPFSRLTTDLLSGPVSNPVSVFVPAPLIFTTPYGVESNDSLVNYGGVNSMESENQSSAGKIPIDGYNLKQYSIAISVGMFLISVMIVTYLIFCITQRNRRTVKRNALCSTNLSEPSTEDTARNIGANIETKPAHFSSIDTRAISYLQKHCEFEQQMNTNSNYQAIEPPDHHIVGLPMCNDQSEYQTNHFMGRFSPTLYSACGTLSVISSNDNTQPRQGRMLSPYESWTASQLLSEHECRVSPIRELLGQSELPISNIEPPPIPPLPLNTNPFTMYSDAAGESSERQQPPAYSTIQKNGTSHLSHASPKSSTNNTSISASSPNPESSQSILGTGEKKRRNVTMV